MELADNNFNTVVDMLKNLKRKQMNIMSAELEDI